MQFFNSVSIGCGVQLIEMFTFSGCKGLTSVVIPDNVVRIYNRAFARCDALKSVNISEDCVIDFDAEVCEEEYEAEHGGWAPFSFDSFPQDAEL